MDRSSIWMYLPCPIQHGYWLVNISNIRLPPAFPVFLQGPLSHKHAASGGAIRSKSQRSASRTQGKGFYSHYFSFPKWRGPPVQLKNRIFSSTVERTLWRNYSTRWKRFTIWAHYQLFISLVQIDSSPVCLLSLKNTGLLSSHLNIRKEVCITMPIFCREVAFSIQGQTSTLKGRIYQGVYKPHPENRQKREGRVPCVQAV